MSWHSTCYRHAAHIRRAVRPSSSAQPHRHAKAASVIAPGFPHRPIDCPCSDNKRRNHHAALYVRYEHEQPQDSPFASTSSSTSNLDLHPAPIDTSLFEDEVPEVYASHLAHSVAQEAINYQAPSPAAILQKALASTGEHHIISREQLGEAYATLQQLRELHSDLGPPQLCYVHAAVAAFPLRLSFEALDWLSMIPSWADDSINRFAIAMELERILHRLKERASREPVALQTALQILFTKQWHSQPSIHAVLSRALINAFQTVPEHLGIQNLWAKLASVMDSPGEGIDQRRLLMSRAYHIALHSLALSGRLEDAAKHFMLSDPFRSEWSPPVAAWTWKLLLEEIVCSSSDQKSFLVHELQGHVRKIHLKLLEEPHQSHSCTAGIQWKGEGYEFPLEWTVGHAASLISIGERFIKHLISNGATSSLEMTEYPDMLYKQAQQAALDLDASRTPEDGRPPLTRQGPVTRMFANLAERDTLGNSIVTAIASHQLRLLGRSGVDLNADLPSEAAPIDHWKQKTLIKARGGKGLWEMAYIWLLAQRHQYRSAVHYFTHTWHTTQDVSTELLEKVLGEPFASSTRLNSGSKDFLLWPSSYCLNVLNTCIVCTVLEGAGDLANRKPNWKESLESGVSRLEECYLTWKSALLRMQQSGSLDVRRLDAYAFEPWLWALLSQYAKLTSVIGLEPGEALDGSHLFAKLAGFECLASPKDGWDPSTLAPGTHRALQILQDMQTLDVEPSFSNYTIILYILGRDAPHSWALIEHICRRVGMTPETFKTDGLPSKAQLMITFTALLKGLHSVPRKAGGKFSAVAEARKVREWLRDLTLSDRGREPLLAEEDISNHKPLVAMLQFSLGVEKEAVDSGMYSAQRRH